MALDFWNNPIIVSAFRVKYRKSSLLTRSAMYLLFLTLAGALFQYYQDRLGGRDWPKYYFLALMTLQFMVSALIASASTTSSIKTEVVNRTLDFQRIAALSPRQILIGKLLGEPAMAYLLAFATLPLSVWCLLMGAVTPEILAMLYLSLATTTLLFGTMGLGNRLEPPLGQADIGLVGLVGIWTPAPLFTAMRQHDPWMHGVPFLNFVIPAFVCVPVVQLVMSYLAFRVMERRLLNPLLPPYSKPLGYGLMLAILALAGAGLYFPPPPIFAFSYKIGVFCLVHLLTSLWLITVVTPWRETLESWVWRFRGRLPLVWDLLVGERSANGLVLLVYCLMGAAGLVLLVIVPAALSGGRHQVNETAGLAVSAMLITILLILALGTIHQRAVLMVGRSGSGAFFLLMILLDLPPHLLGLYYQSDLLMAFSPSAHFVRWFKEPERSLNVIPVVATYAAIFLLTWISLRRRLRCLERTVEQKLQLMGLAASALPGGS